MDKIDGMALQLVYNSKGVLTQATTRGNGFQGELVLNQVRFIQSIPQFLDPKFLPLEAEELIVNGEVFFPLSIFQSHQDLFDSTRNALVGAFGRKHLEQSSNLLKEFQFQAYDCLGFKNSENFLVTKTFWEKLELLEKLKFFTGIKIHRTHCFHASDLSNLSNLLHEHSKIKRDYACDGLVFRVNNEKNWWELGATAHHPRGSLAWKPETPFAISQIQNIEMDVSRHGKLTFRAQLEPVKLSGALISYASLHSASFIQEKGFRLGDEVSVKRSGDVIPKIINRLIPGPTPYQLPSHCPCQKPVTWKGKDLFCSEPCLIKKQAQVLHYTQSLDIPFLGKQTVQKLFHHNLVKRTVDLYRLTEKDFLKLEGFETKSAQNLKAGLEATRHQEFGDFLNAIGLMGLGRTKAKKIAQQTQTWTNLINLTQDELQTWEGWGEQSACLFLESLHQNQKDLEDLLSEISLHESSSAKLLSNWNVVFTGSLSVSRSEWGNFLRKQGASVSNQINQRTSYLIVPKKDHQSKKIEQAKKLQVLILTEDELKQKLLEKNLIFNP
jgi:DNA ligase (NAD+)